MSLCKPSFGLKRKHMLKKREENLIRTLTYQDSDDGSGQEDSSLGSSPMCSPERRPLFERHDDNSPDFLEMDLPECAMISSPKSARRFQRRRARFSPEFSLDDVEEEAQQVGRHRHKIIVY